MVATTNNCNKTLCDSNAALRMCSIFGRFVDGFFLIAAHQWPATAYLIRIVLAFVSIPFLCCKVNCALVIYFTF